MAGRAAKEEIEKPDWKLLLKRANELRALGAETLFERVGVLIAVYESPSYREYCMAQEIRREELLDAELSDITDRPFLTVKSVYERNPDADIWKRHGFRYLLNEWLDDTKKPKKQGRSYKKEYEALQEELERLREEFASYRREAEAKIATLENALRCVSKS